MHLHCIWVPLATLIIFGCLWPLSYGFPLTRRALAEVEVDKSDDSYTRMVNERVLKLMTRKWQHRHRKRLNSIREALKYLHQYGYLDDGTALTKPRVSQALRAFQQTAGVTSDGQLSAATVSSMRKPRCGNVDVKPPKHRPAPVSRRKRFVQFNGRLNCNKKYLRRVVEKAFALWSEQVAIPSLRTVKLVFKEASSSDDADITLMWAEGEHGDQFKFDGGGNLTNILAHTFYPNYQETGSLNGDIHFDDFETWVLDNSNGEGRNFPYVMVHEIGHALGLGHSKRQEAIMNPIYKEDPLHKISLDLDDKCAINWNYVGPTNMCLFVWLMAEILPRASENSNNRAGEASVSDEDLNDVRSSALRAMATGASFEEKLNATLKILRESAIPLCSESNDVQVRYEVLLEQRLDFPRESARNYSAVVCNFLDGLSERVNGIEGPGLVADPVSNRVDLLTAHQYEHAGSADFMRLVNGATDRRSTRRRQSRHHRRRHRHRRHHRHRTVYDRRYFDTHFFDNFFHFVLQ